MVAGALDLHGLAVQEESLVHIEGKAAHSEADPLCIANLAFGFHGDHSRIEMRRLGRPQQRRWNSGRSNKSPGSVSLDRLRCCLGGAHLPAFRIENLPAKAAALRLVPP